MRAWKMMLAAGARTASADSASRPLPKKMTLGLFIFSPKSVVVFDFFVIIDRLEVTLVIHAVKSCWVILDVVDEKNSV